MIRLEPLTAAAAMAAVVVLTAAACSGGDPSPTPTPPTVPPTATEAAAPTEPAGDHPGRPDLEPLIRGPVSPDGFQAILGTPDLGVGERRVGVLITAPWGVVGSPTAEMTVRRGDGGGVPLDFLTATYQPWPLGARGLYTTDVDFGEPGTYLFDIDFEDRDGVLRRVGIEIDVAENTRAPDIGEPAPRSQTKTLDQAGSFDDLTTGSLHDADLYQVSLADAVENGLPTVVVFASPAFCINAVCGPQVEALQELKNANRGQANFVHVDFFDNPKETQDDINAARLSAAVIEWDLPGIEWTFVIDREGVVSHRFEAYATVAELERALSEVL